MTEEKQSRIQEHSHLASATLSDLHFLLSHLFLAVLTEGVTNSITFSYKGGVAQSDGRHQHIAWM